MTKRMSFPGGHAWHVAKLKRLNLPRRALAMLALRGTEPTKMATGDRELKTKIVLFLGSGFSAALGLPTTDQLSGKLLGSFGDIPAIIEEFISTGISEFWKTAFGWRPGIDGTYPCGSGIESLRQILLARTLEISAWRGTASAWPVCGFSQSECSLLSLRNT